MSPAGTCIALDSPLYLHGYNRTPAKLATIHLSRLIQGLLYISISISPLHMHAPPKLTYTLTLLRSPHPPLCSHTSSLTYLPSSPSPFNFFLLTPAVFSPLHTDILSTLPPQPLLLSLNSLSLHTSSPTHFSFLFPHLPLLFTSPPLSASPLEHPGELGQCFKFPP